MPPIILRVSREQLGRDVELPYNFSLGSTYPGPWGVVWTEGPGIAQTQYWVCWPSPYEPLRIHRRKKEYVICLDDVSDDAAIQASGALVGSVYLGC